MLALYHTAEFLYERMRREKKSSGVSLARACPDFQIDRKQNRVRFQLQKKYMCSPNNVCFSKCTCLRLGVVRVAKSMDQTESQNLKIRTLILDTVGFSRMSMSITYYIIFKIKYWTVTHKK